MAFMISLGSETNPTKTGSVTSTAASESSLEGGEYIISATVGVHLSLNGAATTNHFYLPADSLLAITIPDQATLSIIRNSADGSYYLTRVNKS